MIGATSGLTFNVIGHLKLIIVLAGGVAFFGDQMPPKKLAGVCVALAGIAWYSFQVRMACRSVPSAPNSSDSHTNKASVQPGLCLEFHASTVVTADLAKAVSMM